MGKYFVEITSPARQHLLALKKSGQKVLCLVGLRTLRGQITYNS